MADNVTLNTMTGGSVIGADEITSVQYQRVKIIQGAEGTNDGDVCAAAPLNVTGTFVRVEDAGETAGTGLAMVGAVRRDTLASSSTTDGDNSTLNTNATGALWVCPSGNVAHDAGDSGNPIKMGAKVESTPSAQVCADADRTDLIADMDGALLVRTECTIGDLLTESVSNTNGTATASAVFTTGAGIRNVICNIIAYNSSATGGTCILTDGSGGTTLMTVPLPAGGGCVIPLGGAPIKTTAATALYYDVSGALTTVYLTFTGYRTRVT